MRRIVITALTIMLAMGLSSCSNKKKDIPLFLALLGGDSGRGSQASNPSGGSTGVPTPEGSTIQEIDGTTVVIHFPSDGDTSSDTTGTGSSTVDSSESTGNGTSEEPSLEVNISNNDQTGTPNFNFESSKNIPIEIEVRDDNGPVEGAIVTIVDTSNPEDADVLFQQITGSNGVATGTINVPSTTESVQVNVNLGNSVVSTTVPTTSTNPNTGSSEQLIAIDRDIVVGGSHNPGQHFTDSDGDGIADAYDDYPDDPSRSTLTRFPRSGLNTIAFEDLFPNAGDADLNDYVAFFSIEEDLNAQGRVVSIRGFYQHVARGAGYTHTLNMRLGVSSGARVVMETSKVNGANKVIRQTPSTLTLSSSELNQGFQILGSSKQSISTPNNNAAHANNLSFGDFVNFEITFDTPVTKQSVGAAPYDVFLYVENTKRNIHLPNRYFDSNGKDLFLNSTGFPWAIIIPGRWKWQLESQDIRNPSQTGYADFMNWVNSNGQTHKEWYNNVTNPSRVFPLPEESSLAGYLAKTAQDNWLLLSLSLLFGGLAVGFYLTRKNPAILSR